MSARIASTSDSQSLAQKHCLWNVLQSLIPIQVSFRSSSFSICCMSTLGSPHPFTPVVRNRNNFFLVPSAYTAILLLILIISVSLSVCLSVSLSLALFLTPTWEPRKEVEETYLGFQRYLCPTCLLPFVLSSFPSK